MDGNGRWANNRGMPRSYGHGAGVKRMIAIADHANKLGIKYLTVYALSTENLASRPKEELEGLFMLFRRYFKSNVKKLYKAKAAVKIIGDLSPLPEDVATLLREGEADSPKDAGFTMIFAINYGSRAEILRAANLAAERGKKLDEKAFDKLLYTAGIPDPDFIIRTGGEMRLSNFLTYQAAYAELYFTEVLFPDFTELEFEKALDVFSHRNRRYGNV